MREPDAANTANNINGERDAIALKFEDAYAVITGKGMCHSQTLWSRIATYLKLLSGLLFTVPHPDVI